MGSMYDESPAAPDANLETVLPPLEGIYTIYPHPKYSNMDLRSLMNHLTDMKRAGSTNVPAFMFIADGVHDEGVVKMKK